MNLRHTLASLVTAVALAGAASHALAAAAVAAGSNGYTFTVTDEKDLEKAKADALAECRQRAPDCEVIAWTARPAAIALAKSADGSTYSKMRDTPALARDEAMKACRKERKGCEFAALYWETGGEWAAWATANAADGTLLNYFFAYSYSTENEARQTALAGCAANPKDPAPAACKAVTKFGAWTRAIASSPSYTAFYLAADRGQAEANAVALCRENSRPGETCKIVAADQNGAPRAKPASFDKVFAQTKLARERARASAARPSSPPRGQALTCTNRCVNGSCVRTFSNGHTERWEAPRVLDPFTNNWKWDTSSCGS